MPPVRKINPPPPPRRTETRIETDREWNENDRADAVDNSCGRFDAGVSDAFGRFYPGERPATRFSRWSRPHYTARTRSISGLVRPVCTRACTGTHGGSGQPLYKQATFDVKARSRTYGQRTAGQRHGIMHGCLCLPVGGEREGG